MNSGNSELDEIVDCKELDEDGEKAYQEACDEVGGDFEDFLMDHELIAESEFSDYAYNYADDLYTVDFSTWPFNCIDWEQAASDLQMDYTSIEINGTTYYYRG